MSSASMRISRKLQALALALDETLKEEAGERMAFVMLIAPFGGPGVEANYISNIERGAAQELMREYVAVKGPAIPLHKKN